MPTAVGRRTKVEERRFQPRFQDHLPRLPARCVSVPGCCRKLPLGRLVCSGAVRSSLGTALPVAHRRIQSGLGSIGIPTMTPGSLSGLTGSAMAQPTSVKRKTAALAFWKEEN